MENITEKLVKKLHNINEKLSNAEKNGYSSNPASLRGDDIQIYVDKLTEVEKKGLIEIIGEWDSQRQIKERDDLRKDRDYAREQLKKRLNDFNV